MKNIINRITFVLAAVTLLISCEADYIMFDSSKNFVAFPEKSTAIPEHLGTVGIPVYVVALEGSPAVEVNFDFNVEGISAPAVEGEDFTLLNTNKFLSFPGGAGYDTIWIQPIDNDVFTGNKMLNLVLLDNSQNYQFGANTLNSVTILDNEHPLKNWIGAYTVEALSYGNPGTWDEEWDVSIVAVDGELSKLQITINSSPYGGPGNPFLAEFDTEAMTISIAPGTDAGNIYGYASTYIYMGDYSYVDKEVSVVGTIEEDGTIKIDELSMSLPDDSVWDAFNSTWTKTGKKSARVTPISNSKADRFK